MPSAAMVPARGVLHSELRSAVLQRQDSMTQIYGYRKSEKHVFEEQSWAASSLNMDDDRAMKNVLDELKKKERKKKKKPSRHRDDEDEVRKLHVELRDRMKNKPSSLYGAHGDFDGTRKASLDSTKKSILDEIRRKSSRHRSKGKSSSSGPDDYGLLGSTKSNVLDELKKRSKKKKKKPRSSTQSGDSDDGYDEPIDLAPWDALAAQLGSKSTSLSTSVGKSSNSPNKFMGESNDMYAPSLEGQDRVFFVNRENSDYPKGRSQFRFGEPESCRPQEEEHDRDDYADGDRYSQKSGTRSRFDVSTDRSSKSSKSPFEEYASPVPQKSSLHSELKKRFKSPSRNRALMHKYSNYRHHDHQAEAERASLHEELQARVEPAKPKYSRYSSSGDTKSTLLEELKSRTESSSNKSSLDPHLTKNSKSRRSSLDEGHGSYYIPGITAKARTLDADDTVDTQDLTEDDTSAPTPSFFIPGITGAARCVADSDRSGFLDRTNMSTQRRRVSTVSAVSDESVTRRRTSTLSIGSDESIGSDRVDWAGLGRRRSSTYNSSRASVTSASTRDRSLERRRIFEEDSQDFNDSNQRSSVDLEDIIRGAQSTAKNLLGSPHN